MPNYEQIIEQMLLDETITKQQYAYLRERLVERPSCDIAEALEKAKALFPVESNTPESDILHVEGNEERVDLDKTQTDFSRDTLKFEHIEQPVELEAATLGASNNLETIKIQRAEDSKQELDATLIIPAEEHPPSQLTFDATSRYTLSDSNLIGEGGMGRVTRIFDTHLGRNVAHKELKKRFTRHKSKATTSIAQRFLREARITAQLAHPGIVPVYEVGENDDGILYYTMQELTGRTLQDVLAECTSLDERMQLMGHMVDFCQAIGFAHSKGIIHRDIKTENVMIDEHGQTIVLDWGLAKSLAETEELETGAHTSSLRHGKTRMGAVMGTPCYMSPEQAVGDIHNMTATTDVWSLGIVLFEIITGELPFTGENTKMLFQKIRNEDLPKALDLEPKASKSLCAILEKALQKLPSDRYQNAALLAQDIQAWQLGAPVSVYVYSWQDKLEKWFVHNRNTALSSLLGIALLMVSIVMGTISIAQKNIEVELERDRAIEAEKSVRVSRVRAKLQAIESKIDKLESESSFAHAYALKRAYIDVKEKEYTQLHIKDDHGYSPKKDVHHLFQLATKVVPSKMIPYNGGEVYTIATNKTSIVVGYSNSEIRCYSLDTGEVLWTHTVQGRPIDVRWLSETKLLILDVERSDDINIQVLNPSGNVQGILRTVPFTNKDFDYTRMFAYHQESNRLILYSDGQIVSLQLDSGAKTGLFRVSEKDIAALKLSQDQQYLAIAHRSSLTVIELKEEDSTFPVTFVHPQENPSIEIDYSMILDLVWVNDETIVFRDYEHIWTFSLENRVFEQIHTAEKRANVGAQIWHLNGTDTIVTESSRLNDQFVKLNWKTGETSRFDKEKYNLPNRTQIQSIEHGQWWGYSKEEKIILQDVDGSKKIEINKFSSDIITLHHPKDGVMIAGNNNGNLQIINYTDHIHPFYPIISFANDSELSEFSISKGDYFFRFGHIQDHWFYATTPRHNGSTLYLFNTLTKESRVVTFDENIFLCDVLEHSTDEELALSFSNPCDNERGGGIIRETKEYEFGVTHIPFPTTSMDMVDVDIKRFSFDLHGSILQSFRTIVDDEKIYSDEDCVHFVDLNEEEPTPTVECAGDSGMPYDSIALSPDGTTIAFYNKTGRVGIWNRETRQKEPYTSLGVLGQLSCEAASLIDNNHLKILCSNTLYTFDLHKDTLVHTMPFVSDVTDLITTPDGAISLVTSKTKKKIWKLDADHKVEEYSFDNAQIFVAISPDKRFVMTNGGALYILDTMTPVLSIGAFEKMMFSEDSKSMIVAYQNRIRVLPIPDVSLDFINQKDIQLHNLRVCYQSLDIVPVTPFPMDRSPWAEPKLCARGQ